MKEELASIAGADRVSDDPQLLELYSRDSSFVQPRMPDCIVFPKSAEEVQGIIRLANKRSIPVTPRSSSVSFHGAGIPAQGGIILDLSRMNRILEVDPRDRKVRVEPGVTWEQVQEELGKQGLMVCNPLLPHRDKSVLTSAMEREPILNCKTEYNETLLTAELVLGNGDMYWTGTAIAKGMVGRSNPEAFILGTRLFLGGQGTLGVMTWANIKAELVPSKDKLFFMPSDRLEDLVRPLYQVQRRMIGGECLVLNRLNLASIVAERDEEIRGLAQSFPLWTVVLCLSGLRIMPEGRIAYEEEALLETADHLHFEASRTVGGIGGLDKQLLRILRKPWDREPYWRSRFRGASHSLFFYTTLDRAPEFTAAMERAAVRHGYPASDIGIYLQPLERARIVYCEYVFHCDPRHATENEQVRALYLDASEAAIGMGGIFSTPYGPWADMVYRRTGNYAQLMSAVKATFDPNNVMNPGRLCF